MDIVYPTASHRLMRSPSRPRRRRRRPPLSCPCSTCRLATPTLRMRTHARLEWGECARAGGGGESRAPGRWPPTAALGFATLTLSTRPKSSALFMLSMASAASPRSSNWTNAKPRCFSAHTKREDEVSNTGARGTCFKGQARTRRGVEYQVHVGDLAKRQEGRMQDLRRHALLQPTWWRGRV